MTPVFPAEIDDVDRTAQDCPNLGHARELSLADPVTTLLHLNKHEATIVFVQKEIWFTRTQNAAWVFRSDTAELLMPIP